MGLGYDDVKAVNPRIIYCAISGYGCSDPVRTSQGAYDHVIQAFTGMTMLAGTEGDPPVKTGFPVIDAATGIIGALAIVIALRERDRTGAGCFLDVSMWASALQLMYSFACETLTCDQEIPRVGNKGYSGSPGADTFACRDGWLAIGANTPAHVARLMQVLEVASADEAPAAGTLGRGGAVLRPCARSAGVPRAARGAPAGALGDRSRAASERGWRAGRARAHVARVHARGDRNRLAAAGRAG